jgi:XTP/dITP diphosphohydrolase
MEAKVKEQGRSLKDMTLEEMETLWQEAKASLMDSGKLTVES